MNANHSAQNSHLSDNDDLDFSGYENLEMIRLEKGPKGLGFAIMYGSPAGDKGIFIKTLIPGGPAAAVSFSSASCHTVSGIFIVIIMTSF